MTRVTILWAHWSGYMDACARALVEGHGCAVTIGYIRPEGNAPFAEKRFFDYPCKAVAVDPMHGPLPAAITDSPPEVLLVCGWHLPAYKALSRALARCCTRVLCMDNQWRGTFRQRLGVAASRYYIRPVYDFALVPGKRQADFARRLGFRPDEIYEGHYACDYQSFFARYGQRRERPLSHSFMFVGRLVPEKGIDTLLDAWEAFAAGDPRWTLKIVGGGTYARAGALPPRVEMMGFVQPSALPDRLLEGDVFVLPSNTEPWGLVIHEAASTGMPIICSEACGASDAFVREGENGYIVGRGSSADLLASLRKIAALDEDALRAMGAQSANLAGQRTPSTWAATVIAMAGRMK